MISHALNLVSEVTRLNAIVRTRVRTHDIFRPRRCSRIHANRTCESGLLRHVGVVIADPIRSHNDSSLEQIRLFENSEIQTA